MLKHAAFLKAYVLAHTGMVGRREDGQTMAEYAVILTLIAVAVLTAIGFLSGAIQGVISEVGSTISGS